MKNKITIFALVLLVLVCTGLSAQETTGDKLSVSGEADVRPHNTLLFDLKNYGSPRGTAERVNERLRSGLSSLEYCKLIKSGSVSGKECGSSDCAMELGMKAMAGRVLYGYMSRDVDVEKKRLGTKGIEKYIIRSEEHVTYHILVKVVDIEKGAVIGEVNGKAGPDELDNTVDSMVRELGRYFPPVKYLADKQVEKNPVKKHVKEPAVEKTEGKKVPVVSEDQGIEYSLALYMTFIYPVGIFRDSVEFAAGTGIEARIRNIPFRKVPLLKKIELRPALGCFYFASEAGSVTSYRSWLLSLSAGYSFPLYKYLSITPLFGAGCIIHSVKGDDDGVSGTYADPLIMLKCGFDYPVSGAFSITAAPGFAAFFEKNNTGLYPSFDLGAVYRF